MARRVEVKEAAPVQATVIGDKQFYFIANQHTGPILLPRSTMQGEQRIALPPIELLPGTVTKVDSEEWENRKKLLVLQHYLDMGLLAELNTAGSGIVPVASMTSTNLEDAIPENLKSEEERGENAVANVRRSNIGSVEV